MSTTTEITSIWLIYLFAFAGLGFAGYSTYKVNKFLKQTIYLKIKKLIKKITLQILQVKPAAKNRLSKKDEENDISQNNNEQTEFLNYNLSSEISQKNIDDMRSIHEQIAKGSNVFLFTEYLYLLIFVAVLAFVIFFFGEVRRWTFYTTFSFVLGALTSMLCGYIGMRIAVNSNWKTTYSAQ